jgi:hydrogenase maturation protease
MIEDKTIDLGTKIQHADTLVMGVGNYLMGDEGVGVHIAQAMEKMSLPSYLAALDGGTGGFFLMSYFDEYPHIIFVDATMDGKAAGTVSLTEPKFASDFPNALSVHDVGLKDMIETLYFLGNVPKLYLITISIDEILPMHVGLSREVEKSIPIVVDEILKLAKQIHY